MDTVLDRYADLLIVVGICYGSAPAYPAAAVWLGGMMALSGFILASYTAKEYLLRYKTRLSGGILRKLMGRDVRLFAIFLGALLNRPFEAMIAIGFLSHFGIGWTFVKNWRRPNREVLAGR